MEVGPFRMKFEEKFLEQSQYWDGVIKTKSF